MGSDPSGLKLTQGIPVTVGVRIHLDSISDKLNPALDIFWDSLWFVEFC